MKKNENFFFRHDGFTRGTGEVSEDFYVNKRSAPESGSCFHLNLYLESEWKEYAGQSVCQPESTAFISLVLSGTQRRKGKDEIWHLRAGDVLIDRVRDEALDVAALSGTPLRRIGLEICRSRSFEALCCTLFPERITVIHCRHPEKVKAIMAEMKDEIIRGGNSCRLSTLIFRLLQELFSQQEENGLPEPLQKALAFLHTHGFGGISRDELAEKAGVSVRKLHQLFVHHLNAAPGRYMINRRINYAKELLATRRFSVREAGELAGFSSTEFFIREFRRHTGKTPGKFQ